MKKSIVCVVASFFIPFLLVSQNKFLCNTLPLHSFKKFEKCFNKKDLKNDICFMSILDTLTLSYVERGDLEALKIFAYLGQNTDGAIGEYYNDKIFRIATKNPLELINKIVDFGCDTAFVKQVAFSVGCFEGVTCEIKQQILKGIEDRLIIEKCTRKIEYIKQVKAIFLEYSVHKRESND